MMCMGVTAGAYILTLFAVCTLINFERKNCAVHIVGAFQSCTDQLIKTVLFIDSLFFWHLLQIKYRERVLGLILVSPLCKAPSWTEWFYNKVSFKILADFFLL